MMHRLSPLLLTLTLLLVTLPCTLAQKGNHGDADTMVIPTTAYNDTHCTDSDPKFDFHYTIFFKTKYPESSRAQSCGWRDTGIKPDLCQRFAIPPNSDECHQIDDCSIASFAQLIDLPRPGVDLCWQCWLYHDKSCRNETFFFRNNQNPLPEGWNGNIGSFVCTRYKCSDAAEN